MVNALLKSVVFVRLEIRPEYFDDDLFVSLVTDVLVSLVKSIQLLGMKLRVIARFIRVRIVCMGWFGRG